MPSPRSSRTRGSRASSRSVGSSPLNATKSSETSWSASDRWLRPTSRLGKVRSSLVPTPCSRPASRPCKQARSTTPRRSGPHPHRLGRHRVDDQPSRRRSPSPRRATGAPGGASRRSDPHPDVRRGGLPPRAPVPGPLSASDARDRPGRRRHPGQRPARAGVARGQSRRVRVRRTRGDPPRPPRAPPARRLRMGHPPVRRCPARSPRGTGDVPTTSGADQRHHHRPRRRSTCSPQEPHDPPAHGPSTPTRPECVVKQQGVARTSGRPGWTTG